nr:Chaperone tailless complex polypeptide 1 (TCP-1) [Ipomoea trifida]
MKGVIHALRAIDQIYDLLIEENCKAGDHAILYGNAGAVKRTERERLSLVTNAQWEVENDLEKVGAEIVKRALSYPLKLIAKGAGVNGSVVSEKVFSSDNSKYEYNAAKGNYEDLMAVGIIDPTKVVRCYEGHAASVAKTFFISYLSYKGLHNILNFA